ncbi:MAG: hypothetical protein JW910_12630 [Anaerolineae bacterium]|nr:hypothetical protein [Anaerolineae bacterium]
MADESYLMAVGWGNTAGFDVLPTTYDPRTPTASPGRMDWSGDGVAVVDGYWDTVLIFDALPDAEYAAMLTAAGLDFETQSAKVTLYLPHRDQTWGAWNAIIQYPDGEHKPHRWEPATFRVKLVQQVSYSPP